MRQYTQKQKERAVDLYRSGLSSDEVARRIGCSAATVRRWANEGGAMRTRTESYLIAVKRSRREERERACYLYHQGMTAAEVARVVGRCNDTVLAWIGDGARDKRTALRLHFDNADRIRRIERACRLRADGMALKEIATLFGVSESGVRNWWKSEHNPYRADVSTRRAA